MNPVTKGIGSTPGMIVLFSIFCFVFVFLWEHRGKLFKKKHGLGDEKCGHAV